MFRSSKKIFSFPMRLNFVYAAMIGLVVSGYLYIYYSIQSFFKYDPEIFIVISSLAIVIAAFGFAPLEKRLQVITDKVFFKRNTGYQDTIFKMIKEMVSCLDLEVFKKLIVDIIYNEMRVSGVAFYLRSADKRNYVLAKSKRFKNPRQIVAGAPFIKLLQAEKKIIIKGQERSTALAEILKTCPGEAIVPFFEKEELTGFIMIGAKLSGEDFYKDDIRLLETISHQCVIGLQNSRLHETSQVKIKELTTLLELSRIISSTLDSNEILHSVIKLVVNVIGVDRGILFLYDSKKDEIYSAAGYGASKKNILGITLPIKDSVLGRVFKAGKPVYIPHTTRKTEYVKRLGVKSYVVVPMKAKDKVIGLLTMDNAVSRRSLVNTNMDYLSLIAGQMAVAIENSKLYEDAKEKLRQLSQLNENIMQLQNYNQNILMTMPSAVISFDNTGKIKTFNNTAEVISGLSFDEVKDKTAKQLWRDNPSLLKALTQECSNVELSYQNKKEDTVTLNINTRVLKNTSSHKIGMISVLTDMSEIKMLEKQVRRSDRVTSLGTMVAGIAHEIKNPLTSLKLFIQLMEENKRDPNFWEEYGSVITAEVGRLEVIVENFLGFARTKEVDMRKVKVKDITDKVYQLVKAQCSKENVEVQVVVDDSFEVKADLHKMQQVFLNLILNAVQAMPKDRRHKGKIVLHAELDKTKDQVRIALVDNGTGIPKENLEKLFTPFFTTKQKGTGLGLSIVHKIIEEHDGTIQVESELGRGTVFYIVLPLLKEKVTV
jgi:PAS domain S-box-containing protein